MDCSGAWKELLSTLFEHKLLSRLAPILDTLSSCIVSEAGEAVTVRARPTGAGRRGRPAGRDVYIPLSVLEQVLPPDKLAEDHIELRARVAVVGGRRVIILEPA